MTTQCVPPLSIGDQEIQGELKFYLDRTISIITRRLSTKWRIMRTSHILDLMSVRNHMATGITVRPTSYAWSPVD